MEQVLFDEADVPSQESIESTIFSLPTDILTERQAQVLTLMFRDNMAPKEIATKLDINTRTVRSIKFQALNRLREHYSAVTQRHSLKEEARRKTA